MISRLVDDISLLKRLVMVSPYFLATITDQCDPRLGAGRIVASVKASARRRLYLTSEDQHHLDRFRHRDTLPSVDG
jgi:hypothetical protein